LDEAIARHSKIESFLQQDINARANLQESLGDLSTLFE
jgi:flagellum-specific ATP synthase